MDSTSSPHSREARKQGVPLSRTTPQVEQTAILEIRAGTGGDEAGLFAADLYRMYTRFFESQGWKVVEHDRTEGGIGNIKSVTAGITGANTFNLLRFESGVHRVQRVPKTERGGRIHTSTATVAILPQVYPTKVAVNPQDLKIDTFRASGHGGQNVQKVETAIRITHLPTGVTVACQDERSQLQNRERAIEILRAKLYQMMREQQKSRVDELRREQVGTAERVEKIRTWNFAQIRVTDHRVKKSWGNLESILDGNLSPILNAFRAKS